MVGIPVRMLTQEHDLYVPLALGEVTIPGVDLRLRRVRVGTMTGMLERIYDDPEVDIGEASFARYVGRIAEGDRSAVALPAFVVRSFRHRAIYIRRAASFRWPICAAGPSASASGVRPAIHGPAPCCPTRV